MITTLTTVTPDVLAEIQEEMALRRTGELFLLFPLGSQFDHLIVLGLSKLGLYCLVADPAKITAAQVRLLAPKGIILSGGPASVHVEVPSFDGAIFDLGIPVLGICLGFQLWAHHAGFTVAPAERREFGVHVFTRSEDASTLLADVPQQSMVQQSHGDEVLDADAELHVLGSTNNTTVAAAHWRNLWGVQFHPEVSHTEYGAQVLENFCRIICGAQDYYPVEDEAERKVGQLTDQIGASRILLALSGGSDSSVVAYLLKHAVWEVPGRIRAVYIRGIDRPDDEAFVHQYFGNQSWLELVVVDASEQFVAALAGQTTMKAKRVAMRGVYKQVLEDEAARFGASFIAQGTLYTDISESGGGHAAGAGKAQIKLHHNTGLGFSLAELTPLDDNVKDTARAIGKVLGVPEELLYRHPFPGPGLVVRIDGEATSDKLRIARAADGIYIAELRHAGLYDTIWQAGAVVTNSMVTCTKGDDQVSGLELCLWAVWSVNGFTATWAELPTEFLRRVSLRLTNEIPELGVVTYRISDKPPTTIEWG